MELSFNSLWKISKKGLAVKAWIHYCKPFAPHVFTIIDGQTYHFYKTHPIFAQIN